MNDQRDHWDRVDGRVFVWVHEVGKTQMQWDIERNDPFPGLEDLAGWEVDDALRRLYCEGLIDGKRVEADYFNWSRLRTRSEGLRQLGEWPPDVDDVESFVMGILEGLDREDDDSEHPVRDAAKDFLKGRIEDVRDDFLRRGGQEIGS